MREQIGDRRINVICHCLGSVAFLMGLFAKTVQGVTSVIANSGGLTPRTPRWSRIKARVGLPLIERVLDFPYVNPLWSEDPILTRGKIFSKVVSKFDPECDVPACHMLSFMWGSGRPALYSHENLSPITHRRGGDLYGPTSVHYQRHVFKMVWSGNRAVEHDPSNPLHDPLPDDYFQYAEEIKTPTLFVTGRQNYVFSDSNIVCYKRLKRFAGDRNELHVFDGYGHQDVFMGKDVASDIFPRFLDFFAKYRSDSIRSPPPGRGRARRSCSRPRQQRAAAATAANNVPRKPAWRRLPGTLVHSIWTRRLAMGRTVALAILAAAAFSASRAAQLRKRANGRTAPRDSFPLPASDGFSSDDSLRHDSIDGLGYDWSRIANPHARPRYPLRIYLPQSTDDVVTIVKEASARGERLTVRGNGHSSNDLVTADRGSILLTEKMDKVLALDPAGMTITVQAGAISADVDAFLGAQGYGLPVLGDHNHITVGGFASVGGISPASHRYGLFIDNIAALEYVTWDGSVVRCSRTEEPHHFYRVLAGHGQFGVITTLTCHIIEIDKLGTVLRNHQEHFLDREAFIRASSQHLASPGAALMERGVWLDYPLPRGSLGLGQFSMYAETSQTASARLRNRLAYGYLHALGAVAGRLPDGIDRGLKMVGTAGVMFSPTFASIKNIEFFTDRILDASVGDPTRMLIALAPLEEYEALFRSICELMERYREEFACLTFISAYVKSIRSAYLSHGELERPFCELMFYLGVNSDRMTDAILENLVSELDDLCIAHRAFRYMHSRTTKDPGRLSLLDPNAFYADSFAPADAPAAHAV